MERTGNRAVVLCLLLLNACAVPVERNYQAGRDALRREQYDTALAIAGRGLKQAGRDRQWAWRFRLLEAETLLARREAGRALAVLHGAPPAPPEANARALLLEAQAKYLLSDYGEARRLLAAAAEAAGRTGSGVLAAEVELRRGSLLVREGRPAEAEQAFRQVIRAAAQLGDAHLEAEATGNLGFALLNASRYDEAIDWFERARALFAAQGAALSVARATGNLGWCYFRLGDPDNARERFREAEVRFAGAGNRFEQQAWIGNGAGLLFTSGDYSGAAAEYGRALEISRQLASDLWTARWLSNLAAAQIELKNWDAAERSNGEALALKRRIGGTRAEVYCLNNAARIAAGRGRVADSERLFREALRAPADDPTSLMEAHTGLASLFVAAGRKAEAETEFAATLGEIEGRRSALLKDEYKLSYFASLIRFYRDYVDYLMQAGEPARALEIADSSRARVLTGMAGQSGGGRRETADAFRRMARQGGAVLVEYWLGPERSCLWVVAPEGVTAHALPPEPEIRRLVNAWNRAIQGQRDPVVAAAEAGRSLSRMLLGPVAAGVAAHHRMVVVADGILHSLNLETLPAGDGPELWIEKAAVSVAPSLNYLAENTGGAARTPGRRVLLVGDADGAGPEFPRLEFAAQEMNSIKSVLPGYAVTELRQAAATPDAYRAARPGGFDIIHFAAHASATSGSPLDSAVVLSGASSSRKLFTRDVVSTPLAATLVTVSGCRSAGARAYAGEGLVGFAWGFLKAGARNVIAALWDVNDRSTARLMMCVYSQLASGSHPEEALRAAKIEMLRAGGAYGKPYYWAPFQDYTRAVR